MGPDDQVQRHFERRQLEGEASQLAMLKVACDEGRRAIEDQVSELDSMRQRAVQFLAFVGSATGFMVGAGLGASARPKGFEPLALAATASSLLTILLVAFLLLGIVFESWRPRRSKWLVRINAGRLVREWIGPDIGVSKEAEFYQDLALAFEKMAKNNKPALEALRRWYWILLVVGSAQVSLWALLVWIAR